MEMLLDEVKETIVRLEKWRVQLKVDEEQWAGQVPSLHLPEMLRLALVEGIQFIQITREEVEYALRSLQQIEAVMENLANFGNEYYKQRAEKDGEG